MSPAIVSDRHPLTSQAKQRVLWLYTDVDQRGRDSPPGVVAEASMEGVQLGLSALLLGELLLPWFLLFGFLISLRAKRGGL
jgi:hypothetical protein